MKGKEESGTGGQEKSRMGIEERAQRSRVFQLPLYVHTCVCCAHVSRGGSSSAIINYVRCVQNKDTRIAATQRNSIVHLSLIHI